MNTKVSMLLLFVFSVTFFSCEKAANKSLPMSKTQMLAKNAWMIDETYYFTNGVTTHYKRGGENNTGANYDIVRFTFKVDGTGTNTDGNGEVHQIKWSFSTPEQGDMNLTIYQNPVYVTSWSLVNISESAIYQTNAELVGPTESAKLVPATIVK